MIDKIIFSIIIVTGLLLGINLWNNHAGDNIPESETFSPGEFDWQHNGKNGEYIVKLVQGEIEEKIQGEVLTDENCEKDEEGLSRCSQKVLLDNKKEIEFIMPHNMMKHRCLTPGEKVEISPYAEDGYVKATI